MGGLFSTPEPSAAEIQEQQQLAKQQKELAQQQTAERKKQEQRRIQVARARLSGASIGGTLPQGSQLKETLG